MKYSRLSSACLNLTDDCCLACKYCFVQQKPHYMSLKTAVRAVDFLINNSRRRETDRNTRPAITFFGGEPMLCYDSIIVPLVYYIEKKYPNEISLSITTNGILLTRDRIQFLKDHNINPLLSIDGAPITQDINRPCKNPSMSSSKLVMKNIPDLLEFFPNTTFRATIYQETVQHTFENYLFAQRLGFKSIFFMPNCRDPWSEEQVSILKEEYRKIYDAMILQFRDNQLPIFCRSINNSFEHVLKHDLNTLTNKQNNERSIVRCGLGTSMGSIGYDGSIYGCQEQDSKGKDSIFYIGNIDSGIDQGLHKRLLTKYSNIDIMKCEDSQYCETCPLRSQCGSFACPSVIWDLYGNFYTDSKIHCQWLRIMFEEAVRAMRILVAEDNQLFKKYLYEICHFNKYWKENR